MNLLATFALPETTSPAQRHEAGRISLWSVLVKVLSHEQSIVFILIFSFMFSGATSFNQPVPFDTSKVTTM